MREYVNGLLLNFYNELTGGLVGTPIVPNTLQFINGKLNAYMRYLKLALQLPEIDFVSINMDITNNYDMILNINGLEGLPKCYKVILTEEQFGCDRYKATEVETGHIVGYVDEEPNSHDIALITRDNRRGSRYYPLPVVVVEVNNLQKIGGYWIEFENQGRETCLYCDNSLVKKGRYSICEECDKR